MKLLKELHEIQVNYERNYGFEKISSSTEAHEVCKKVFNLTESNMDLKEYFFIILLNRSNQVIEYYRLSSGGLTSTVADIRLAFSIGLKCLASGMIMLHNHPSYSLEPSQQDKLLTKKFVLAPVAMTK